MDDAMHSLKNTERISLSRLVWVGPAVVANAAVRELSLRIFDISPMFHHLMCGHFLTITVIAVSVAVIVFAVIARYAHRPVHLYWQIAGLVLVLSLVPDVAMLFGTEPRHSPVAVGTLVSMYIVDAAICVVVLPVLTRAEKR